MDTDIITASRDEDLREIAPVPYIVDYFTASGDSRRVEVIAIDAIDAKHLAEAAEGEVIVTAYARKVR